MTGQHSRQPASPVEPGRETATSAAGRIAAWVGRIGGPLLALVVYALLGGSGLSAEARAVASIGVLMASWWMTEALPLPVTALLPIVLLPLAGAASVQQAAAPYADKVIFLFLGGFLIAIAMERSGLHRRIALLIIAAVGSRPRRLVAGFMLATAFLSMWLSNTATTVMMLPIGASIATLTADRLRAARGPSAEDDVQIRRFSACLMLGIAYAASIGGLATLIGTPPNAFLRGFLDQQGLGAIGFAQWMLLGVPLAAAFLIIAWLLLTTVIMPLRLREAPGGRALIRDEIRALGPLRRSEWIVLWVFLGTAFLWIAREPLASWDWLSARLPILARLDDTVIAIGAGALLFAIPVSVRRGEFALAWRDAERLPWGVLLLFGGGLSLASAIARTGVDAWIGQNLGGLDGLPHIVVVVVITTLVIFLTEVTSNTATATTFLPILLGVSEGLGQEPTSLMVPASLAASCAFMLPVATPPNAIVYASGRVTIGQMIKAGVWLNIVGVILITIVSLTLVPLVFGAPSGSAP